MPTASAGSGGQLPWLWTRTCPRAWGGPRRRCRCRADASGKRSSGPRLVLGGNGVPFADSCLISSGSPKCRRQTPAGHRSRLVLADRPLRDPRRHPKYGGNPRHPAQPLQADVCIGYVFGVVLSRASGRRRRGGSSRAASRWSLRDPARGSCVRSRSARPPHARRRRPPDRA